MILFPALDIKDGRAVRLRQGVANEVTVFSSDPVEMAKEWQSRGAEWLHLIDLDGAIHHSDRNRKLVHSICRELTIPVQLGGGIRDAKIAEEWLDLGVKRLLIGTMVLENPKLFAQLCKKYPRQIGASLDCHKSQVKTHGWLLNSKLMVFDLIPQIEEAGAACIVFTDIERDGMHTGINIHTLKMILRVATVPVIAAGGVSTIADVKQVWEVNNEPEFKGKIEGVISGRALYDGSLKFEEAMFWLEEAKKKAL